jgi:parvulin-like peptidyl-prolyl isomerase
MLLRPLGPCLLLLLGSCSNGAKTSAESGAERAAQGALVARVGKVEIREADLKRAMARDPGASAERFESASARHELIDGLVRFELLAQAADRAGFSKDPDALHALQQIAVTKLVNQTLGKTAAPESITSADIQREYLARQTSEFTLPESVQVRHIRVADAKLADRLAARARALSPSDDRAFAALASSTSQDAQTRSTGGDLGFIDKNSRLPSAMVEAALSLKAPGDVTGPIATDSGYEILRLVTRRAAAVSPLSSVAEPIRQRLYRERRAQALDEYIARLRSEIPVEIVEPKASIKAVP